MEVIREIRREYPQAPILGVGGVILRDDHVLLARRAKDPGKGTWTLPGGMVELGETLEDALRREIFEELSLAVAVCGLVRLLDRIVRDEKKRIKYHYVIADYWGYPVSGQVCPGSDVSDAKYVPLEQLQGLGLHKEVVETILTAEEMRKKERRRKAGV